jgi:hypothetical protein
MTSSTSLPRRNEGEDGLPRPELMTWDPKRFPSNDWTIRPFETSSRSPWVVGLGISMALGVASIGFRLVGDDSGYGATSLLGNPYFWVDTLNAILIAYIATTHAMQRRGVSRDLDQLQSVLAGSQADHDRRARQMLCISPGALLAAGIVGGSLIGALPVLDNSYWVGPRPSLTHPIMIFLILRNAMMGWIAAHAILTEIQVTRAYKRLGENGLDIDMLNLSPLGVFARKGQRGAIVWLVASSLVSLFWLGPTATDSNGFILVLILALVTMIFFFPIYGAHRGIKRAKTDELGALREELRRVQSEERQSRGDVALNSRIAALAALHTTVETAREWPIDAPALLRFGLFALLGLISWFGSAIVERLLDTAIG